MTLLAIALLAWSATPASPATPFIPDSLALERTGSYPFGYGNALAVDEARGVAFVSSGSGVLVVDISDPASPAIISDTIRGYAPVHTLWLDRDRLYVGTFFYESRLYSPRDVEIWSVADPAHPALLGSLDFPLGRPGLWARDSLLVVAGRNMFGTYDVSDPGAPGLLDSLMLLPSADMVRVIQDTLALAPVWGSGVEVYDIGDPDSLSLLSTWGHTNTYSSIDIAGNRLFLTAFDGPMSPWSGLRIYDITDPLHGELLGAYDTSRSFTFRVAVKDTVALLSYLGDSLRVLSVADPAHPHLLAELAIPANGVAWGESLAYAAAQDRFSVLDLGDPANPVAVGSVPVSFSSRDLVVDGDRAYTVGRNLGVLELSGPGDVELLGVLELGDLAMEVACQDTLVLVGCYRSPDTILLHVVGVSDPQHPTALAVESLSSQWGPLALGLADTLGLVATDRGLSVYSLADPADPRLVGQCGVVMSPTRMAVVGSACLVAGDRLRSFDLADPGLPVLAWDTLVSFDDMAVDDSLLVGVGQWPLVFDLADPLHPRYRGRSGQCRGMSVAIEDTLVVVSGMYGTTFLSVADPSAPVVVGVDEGVMESERIILRGDTLHAAEYRRYRVLNIPSGLEEERRVPVPGNYDGPTVVRGMLRLEPGRSGVLVGCDGRLVARLEPGENDVSRLAPGVYFLHSSLGIGHSSLVTKVVIQR